MLGDTFGYFFETGDDSRLECDASFNSGLDSAEVGAGAFADAVDDSDSQASSSSHAFRVCRRQVDCGASFPVYPRKGHTWISVSEML